MSTPIALGQTDARDKLLERIQPYGGHVIQTSLSNEGRGAAALRARRDDGVADSLSARLKRIAAPFAAVALAIAALESLGVDVRGWFSDVWTRWRASASATSSPAGRSGPRRRR